MTFGEQIADSIMETKEMKKKMVGSGANVAVISRTALRNFLIAAAKMGAEASGKQMPEHDAEFAVQCKVCSEPIVAEDVDENHSIWVHAQ